MVEQNLEFLLVALTNISYKISNIQLVQRGKHIIENMACQGFSARQKPKFQAVMRQ
jgi:hypothetical protein